MNDRRNRRRAVAHSVDTRSGDSFHFYSWTLVDTAGDRGAVGVNDDLTRALARADEALCDAPEGTRALVHRVTRSEFQAIYRYHQLVARGSYDPVADIVVWKVRPGF